MLDPDNRGETRRSTAFDWVVAGTWIVGAWTLYALYFSAYELAGARPGAPAAARWDLTPALYLIGGYSWALVTPAIIWLARRVRISRDRRLWPIVVHSVASVAVSFLVPAIFVLIVLQLLGSEDAPIFLKPLYIQALMPQLPYHPLKYWVVVGVVHAVDYHRKFRDRELRASQLEGQLAQARLAALRAQLHPHFLFNTLNSVTTLMRRDVEAADRMLVDLSHLLRATLSKESADEVPLDREIEFLERYVDIEQTRFRDRLTVRIDVDPKARSALVPQLVLQPLVENAIRHGMADREEGGLIEVRAERLDGFVRLEVRDNGSGLPDQTRAIVEGIGLANTRARLETLYGSRGVLEIENAAEGGLVVTARLPFRSANGTGAAEEA